MKHDVFKAVLTFIHIIHEANSGTLGPTLSQSWTRTTLMRFRLDLEGFGLTSQDTIRLISFDSTCTDNSGDPMGVDPTIQWNCPDIDAGCVNILASAGVNIPVVAKSWDCVSFDDENNCLGSSVSVISLVTDTSGSILVTFSGDPGLSGGDYIKFGDGVTCGANCVSADLDLLLSGPYSQVSDEFVIGNMLAVNPADPAYTYRIQVDAFASANPPQFVSGTLDWYMTNRVSTRVELLGLVGRVGIQVCWDGGGKAGGYTTQAGVLTVVDPNLVQNGGLYPVSSDPELTEFPLIIAFTTSNSDQYSDTSAGSYLLFSITNPSVFNFVPSTDGVVDCGTIFSELWALRASFPQPASCLVNLAAFEVTIFFAPSNGLQPSTDHQFVVNVSVLDAPLVETANTYLVISSVKYNSGSVQNPESTIDVARVGLVPSLGQPFGGSPFTRVLAMPYLSQAALQVSLLQMDRSVNSLVIELSGGDGVNTGSIEPNSILRIIFYPLTLWRAVESVCQATIVASSIAYTGVGIETCVGESLVAGGQKNVVRIVLPSDMGNVNGADWIRIQISGITVPMGGLFPQTLGVELGQNTAPWSRKYLVSTGQVWKIPELSVAGISEPVSSFAGDSAQLLTVRLKTWIDVPVGGALTIALPPGFGCIAATSTTLLTGWTYASNLCTIANTNVAIFGSVFLTFALEVNFPSISAVQPVFAIELAAGAASFAYNFASTDPDWVPSISVLGLLTDVTVVPTSSWVLSTEYVLDAMQSFAISFVPQNSILNGGTIGFESPYIYPSLCVAADLADYVYYTSEAEGVLRIPGLVANCTINNDQITVSFAGTLITDTKYAFGLLMQNPSSVVVDPVEIFTIDANGFSVDGSRNVINPIIFLQQTVLTVTPTVFVPYSFSSSVETVQLNFVYSRSTGNLLILAPTGFVISGGFTVSVGTWTVGPAVNSNELALVALTTVAFTSFTVTLGVKVPNRIPSEIFQWKIQFADSALIAVSTIAPNILGLMNAQAIPGSTVSGATHFMYFAIQTMSSLPIGEALRIDVPTNLGFAQTCVALSGNPLYFSATTARCVYSSNQIVLTHQWVVPADMYEFLIQAVNPGISTDVTPLATDVLASCGFSSCFNFSTNFDLSLSIPGFGYDSLLAKSGLIPNTVGRDDRPGHWNELILSFAPSVDSSELILTAPPGFVFGLDCTQNIFVGGSIFADNRPWPQFSYSQVLVGVRQCWGDPQRAEVARIFWSATLSASAVSPYAIRVGATNPSTAPTIQDWWTIRTDGAESVSFPTFVLSQFDTPFLTRNVIGASQQGVLSFSVFSVRPLHSVPAGGTLVLWLPATGIGSYNMCETLSVAYTVTNPTLHTSSTAFSTFMCEYDNLSVNLTMLDPLLNTTRYNVSTVVLQTTSNAEDNFWTLNSFDALGLPLDESRVSPDGDNVESPLAFAYTGNLYGNESGLFAFQFQASSDIQVGETILIDAPSGYMFGSNVVCNATGSAISILVASIVQAQSLFEFSVLGTSPSVTPFPDNLFVLTVLGLDGTPRISGSLVGGSIVPQLANVAVSFDNGPNYAVNSVSNLSIFFATVSAMCNRVEIAFPTGFDFSNSVFNFSKIDPNSNLWVPVATDIAPVNELISISLMSPLLSGESVWLTIAAAQLGPVPGPVAVNVSTWADSTLQDARINFTELSLADALIVWTQFLSTNATSAFQLGDFILPRTSEACVIGFNFTFAVPVLAGSMFQVTSAVFPFENVTLSSVTRMGPVPLSNVTVSAETLSFFVNASLEPGPFWLLEISATVPAAISLSSSNFLLDIRRGSITHTNDNTTRGFDVVSPVVFEITTPRTPPSARISVGLEVYSVGDDLMAYSLLVIAPVGFTFDANCLAAGGATSCTPSTVFEGRNSAYVFFENGLKNEGNLTSGLQLSAITPLVSEASDNNWILIANGLAGAETGWGVTPENVTVVEPMGKVSVNYAKRASAVTPVAFSFQNMVKVKAGGKIRVYYPPGFQFDCTTFNQVTLPFYSSSSWDQVCRLNLVSLNTTRSQNLTVSIASDSFDIALLQDLVPGTFSFTLSAMTPPSINANSNYFSILLLTSTNQIIDSYIGLSGLELDSPIYVELVAGLTGFEWFPAIVVGGSKMQIEISFTVVQQISVDEASIPIASIIVFFPNGFANAMVDSSEVSQVTGPTNLIAGVDISNQEWIVIELDTSQKITTGTYSLKFPVFVPDIIPDIDIWYLTFCNTTACETPVDPSAVESLPIGGFLIGQQHPYTRLLVVTKHASSLGGVLVTLVLLATTR